MGGQVHRQASCAHTLTPTECPMCGQPFSLSEVTDCFIFEDFAPKCGGCDESALSGWCKECEEALCSDCVSAHQRVKVTRNHAVIPQEPQSGLSTSLRCTSHKQERLKFFCVTCDQLTCRDCQLIDHRNHRFLLLEEAVVSQKDQLMKLLDSIREQKNSVRAMMQDLDRRLNDIKELKALSEEQLHNAVRSLYVSLVLRCRQLSKELEGLCDEEEKSLKVMKTSLTKLEDKQEYITAFIHKILSTEGQCILRHKMQIEKWAQRILSQKKLLPDTVIQLSLSLREDICNIIKNFGSPSTKHWLTGLPSSFREILSSEIKVPAEDACSRSASEHASVPNAKDDDEKTDDSDSELVEGMDESEEEPILRQNSNKTLLVSLIRLPISGSSQSQFRIVPSSEKSEIVLQEIEENQSVQRCLRITVPPAAMSPSQSCSSECSLQADVLDCAVCLSAGASLQCAECGRSFHTSCHVPPILFNPIAMWVCSLCQDVLDDTDPFSCDRLKEPYLSLSDQRRCEQLLLTLMCENHSYLLYKTIKQSAGCVEFNLIVGRLLGKRSPPYRSAAEMVSDLWALFDNLSTNSKKKDLVVQLQSSFQQRLKVSFGKSLHASLLRPLSSGDQTGAPETESDREKAKNTLKRMRAFLAANCTPVAKKAHTENT